MNLVIRRISQSFLLFAFVVLSVSSVFAQAVPDNAPISDQKAGSVLIYNYYGSSAINYNSEDTKVSITNTNLQSAAMVSLFFIDAVSGDVTKSYICLLANQTASFRMVDVDPGAKGYIVAVSVDATGRPNKFNYLTGSELIKMSSGHVAGMNAEAISALVDSPTIGLNPNGIESGIAATLRFDGVRYNKLPGALVLDYIPPIVEGNKTMIIVNQIGGSLLFNGKPDDLTSLTGTVYDAVTNAHFWQVGNINTCQFRKVIANDFPQTAPNMSTVVEPGRSAWMKFHPHGANKGVTGVVLYLQSVTQNTLPNDSRFTGGRNLHHMTLTTDELTIPIIAPSC